MKYVYAMAILALLVVSVPYDLQRSQLPFYRFWGVDFQNLYAFHHCTLRNAPYEHPQAAEICGDAVHRPMNYPPLLYWSFIWTRPFSWGVALRMWLVFILVATYLGITCFLPTSALSQRKIQLFIGLLFTQFPALYALERANNDAWIVLLWGLAYLCFRRNRMFTAGVIVGIATAAKVYPLFAVLVFFVAFIRDRRTLMRFGGGVAAGGAAICLLFLRSTIAYVGVLQKFASVMPLPSLSSHGLPAFFGTAGVAILGGSLLFFWAAAGDRLHRSSMHDLLFTGALAISTFFSTTSNDYNFITAYPLLAVLFVRSLESNTVLLRIALVALLITITGPRVFFAGHDHQHVALQVLALLVTAAAAMRAAATAPPATPAPQPC